MKFNPRPYQEIIIDAIQKLPRCAVWAGMGLGKTVSTLTALHDLSLVEDVYPILVLAPLRVAKTTWPDEIKKWDHLQDLKVSVITGTKVEREKALAAKCHIATTNYEQLPWLVEHLDTNWPFKTVVIDESTKLKGFRLRQGASRPKALARVAHTKIKRIILLTGTPSPNGLQDLWGQTWFIDKGERLGKSFNAFRERWFHSDYTGFGILANKGSQEEIQDSLKDVCITIKAEDWFNLQQPVINKVMIDLPPKARILYKQMEKDMFMQLEGNLVDAKTAAGMTNKCAQMANGAVYYEDGKEWEKIHDEKIAALEEIIEESAGMPVLVAYRFKSDLARLKRAYPQGRQLDNNPTTISDWNEGKIPILFAHPASAGHGLNLQDGSNILAFFSINWNLEEHLQIIERIGPTRQMQSGHKRPVFLHYILARDTIDETILERIETKRDVQEILLDAMNNYKGVKK